MQSNNNIFFRVLYDANIEALAKFVGSDPNNIGIQLYRRYAIHIGLCSILYAQIYLQILDRQPIPNNIGIKLYKRFLYRIHS